MLAWPRKDSVRTHKLVYLKQRSRTGIGFINPLASPAALECLSIQSPPVKTVPGLFSPMENLETAGPRKQSQARRRLKMNQCDAKTLTSSYSEAHRCLKNSGLKKVGDRLLCGHHRTMQDRKAGLAACRKRRRMV